MNKIIIIFLLTLSIVIVLFECKICFGRDYSSWLDACKPYRETVESILSNEGVSTDYYYLMVAESRCKHSAKSHAGARGFWQLMPHTTRAYGCDNPDDLECATKAAAKYLKALEFRFDTFQDVIAAWNMGGHNYKKHGISAQALGLVYRVKQIMRADRGVLMVLSEHEEQKKLMKWWQMYSSSKGIPEELLFAIPNGGKRDVITAKVLQSEGVRPGVPDLFLALETYTHAGLFIEMKKAKGGVVSDKQRAFSDTLQNHTSYQCKVCRGFEEARDCIQRYICTGEV